MSAFAKISVVVSSQLIIAPSNPKGTIPMAMVVQTPRGAVTPQTLYGKTGLKQLSTKYGTPNLKYGKSGLYANTLLDLATDNLTTVRAVSEASLYAGMLLRTKTGDENLTDLTLPFELDPVLKGVNGLSQQALDSYNFPVYPRTREFDNTNDIYNSNYHDLANNTMYLNSVTGLTQGTQMVFVTGTTPSLNHFTIETIGAIQTQTNHRMTITVVTNNNIVGKYPYSVRPTDLSFSQHTLGEGREGTDFTTAVGVDYDAYLESSDLFVNGITVDILANDGAILATATVTSKTSYEESIYKVTFDSLPPYAPNKKYWVMTAGATEHRDLALITPKGQGIDGNLLSIDISDSTATTRAFNLKVYYQGILKEEFTCSPIEELDGNGIQIFVETIIDKNSEFISWKTNPAMVDNQGVLVDPLRTSKYRWLRNSEPYFTVVPSTSLLEDVNKNDTQITVTGTVNIAIGDRIKLVNPALEESLEYKIIAVTTVTTFTLDRPIEETQTIVAGSTFKKVDITYQDNANNIYDGFQRYPILEVEGTLPNYITKSWTIGTNVGIILDAGANNLTNGDDGNPLTTSELIQALKKIEDKELYPYFFLADSGFTQTTYANALIQQAKNRRTTVAFLSAKLSSEYATDVVKAVSDDFIALNYTGHEFTFSTDWFYMDNIDTGQIDIPMPPSLSDLIVEAGAIQTDNIWTSANGWRKGKYISGGLVNPKNETMREVLAGRGINSSKVKRFKGVAKWSDLTGLNQATPLQYLSIKKLTIYVIENLLNFLEDVHFEDYIDRNIDDLTGDIEEFLAFVLSAGGIYSSKVVIGQLVNDTTVNIRKLPIYVAINGTQSIQGIAFGLDVQQGTSTSVNLEQAQFLTA